MSNLPSQVTPSYATDEDLLVRAGGDWVTLCPGWQLMASGTDGVFATGFPWVLTSTSTNFGANGVTPNQVVWLTAPQSHYRGGGDFLAIDSVSGTSMTLRRPHKDLNVGQPPAPAAGLTGVAFRIQTMDPQIEDASFDLRRRFGIQDSVVSRSSTYVFDLRDLRSATILTVLLERYIFETRSGQGDFALKIARVQAELNLVINRVQVRWGPTGASAEPSSIFGTKLCR